MIQAALSIAYIKLGLISQASTILEEGVKKSAEWILDSSCIHFYSLGMKTLSRYDLIEAVWEKAAQADKKNVKTMESLFGACLQSGNSARQISSALDLWKQTNDDKYLMWSIVARALPQMKPDVPRAASIAGACPIPVLTPEQQAQEKPNQILQLAYMLFDSKFIQANKVKNHLDLDFMIRVLLQLGQGDKAVDLLRSDLAKKLYGIAFQRLSEEAATLLRLNRLPEARACYETLLDEHNADEWSWYLGLFDSVFGKERPVANIDSKEVDSVRKHIHTLQAKTVDGAKLRGAFLAELELEKIAGQNSFALLVSYFETFVSKPSTYRDLLSYVRNMDTAAQHQFLENCKPFVLLDPAQITAETPLGAYIGMCTYKGLLRSIKSPTMTAEDRKSEIESLWTLYNTARNFEAPREATERFCADDLLAMIAHYYCDAYLTEVKLATTDVSPVGIKSFDTNPLSAASPLRHLVSAACTLEHGIAHSKWNFQFKLLLNEVYYALGAVRSLIDQFDSVDVKHVQLDSVSWLFTDALVRNAAINDLTKINKRAQAFYDESRRTASDFAYEAFLHGAYHKVQEILHFSDRINESVYKLSLRLESTLLSMSSQDSGPASGISLLHSFGSIYKLPNTIEEAAKLSRNYDLEVLDWWSLVESAPKHIEIPAGGFRTSCFPDFLQNSRLLANSLFIQAIIILAEYQAPAPGEKAPAVAPAPLPARLAPIAEKLEETVAIFKTGNETLESLVWDVVTATFKFTLNFFALSPALCSDKPDAEHVNAAKDAAAAISNAYERLNTLLKASGDASIVSSTNTPILTQFITRSLVALPLCMPLLPKLLPGKARPKTPEEVKSQTSAMKTVLREVAESSRKQIAHFDSLLAAEAANSSNFSFAADQSTETALNLPSGIISIKLIGKVLDSLSFARKDAIQTLQGLLSNKTRDYKAL